MNVYATGPRMPDGLEACIDTVNAATLEGDFDEARLCLAQMREKLVPVQLDALMQAVDRLRAILGPAGATPSAGLGRALVNLSDTFERVQAR